MTEKISLAKAARLIGELMGDDCACNFFDDWLPYKCPYSETDRCPDEVDCWLVWLKAKMGMYE